LTASMRSDRVIMSSLMVVGMAIPSLLGEGLPARVPATLPMAGRALLLEARAAT